MCLNMGYRTKFMEFFTDKNWDPVHTYDHKGPHMFLGKIGTRTKRTLPVSYIRKLTYFFELRSGPNLSVRYVPS